jgi:hypothetical protein
MRRSYLALSTVNSSWNFSSTCTENEEVNNGKPSIYHALNTTDCLLLVLA